MARAAAGEPVQSMPAMPAGDALPKTADAVRSVGILGGSFNPIHHAHLFTAEAVAAAFDLERVLVVPAAQSPLKDRARVATPDRVAMVRLAIEGNPLLELSTVEVDRPPPSYTVDTVEQLRRTYPAAKFSLIVGIDTLVDLLEWRAPERLLDLCRVIAVSRPGYALAIPPELRQALGPRIGRIHLLPMLRLEISSTDLRRRFAAGEPVRYLLPSPVEAHIRARGLYGAVPLGTLHR